MGLALTLNVGSSHEPTRQDDKIVSVAFATGYKGGLPFCTAFHQEWTTRLLLLNAASDIPELRQYLRITDAQSDQINELELFNVGGFNDKLKSKLLDQNSAVDEEMVDSRFYAFLDDTQLELLDRLALEFDGCSGLSRISIANRLALSEETRRSVASTLVKYREQMYLPYFRHCFAAKLPADHKFRDCEFSGRYLALLNQSILVHLSRDERKRHDEWVLRTALPNRVIEAIKLKSPLPEGLFALATRGDN